jgi:hypothetical protein
VHVVSRAALVRQSQMVGLWRESSPFESPFEELDSSSRKFLYHRTKVRLLALRDAHSVPFALSLSLSLCSVVMPRLCFSHANLVACCSRPLSCTLVCSVSTVCGNNLQYISCYLSGLCEARDIVRLVGYIDMYREYLTDKVACGCLVCMAPPLFRVRAP